MILSDFLYVFLSVVENKTKKGLWPGYRREGPATCNLKVKHRPSGSPITVYSLMGTLQTCILGAQRASLFIPSLVLCHGVGNDCGHGTWPDQCSHVSIS